MFGYVSDRCKDHFDFVVNDSLIYGHPSCPDRWPDEGNGADSDPDDAPEIVWVDCKETFVASQPRVTSDSVEKYARDITRGAVMPPVAAIKCPDGIIVWNGHHRLSAHRLAGAEKVPVRFWATLQESFTKFGVEDNDDDD